MMINTRHDGYVLSSVHISLLIFNLFYTKTEIRYCNDEASAYRRM